MKISKSIDGALSVSLRYLYLMLLSFEELLFTEESDSLARLISHIFCSSLRAYFRGFGQIEEVQERILEREESQKFR